MNRNDFLNFILGIVLGILILGILYFVFISGAFAKQEDKVYWCHCEPNGNCQTLHLPMQALEQAGHVDANGNPLHAGDYAGECEEPSVTPTVTPSVTPGVTVTPTKEPEVSPTPSVTPDPTVTPTIIQEQTIATDVPKSDGKSDGRSSCPECTQTPKYSPWNGDPVGWK
jgi:hypothetical protein